MQSEDGRLEKPICSAASEYDGAAPRHALSLHRPAGGHGRGRAPPSHGHALAV